MQAHVSSLFRFPVKSMMGEQCGSLNVGPRGAVGDRVWAVRDEKRGGIRGGKKIPSLMTLTAGFTGDVANEGSSEALITAPDGDSRTTGAEDINSWLSDKLDHPVSLWPLLPEDAPLRRGDTLFWKGHVAWVVDHETILHANAHHMAVVYEPIAQAVLRIEAQGDGAIIAQKRLDI